MAKKPDSAAIWRDLEAKTRDISAWVVFKNGEMVAKLITHYGGRNSPNGLTVKGFVHVLGLPCVRGVARGGGYDMRTAALAAACAQIGTREIKYDPRDVGRDLEAIALNAVAEKFRTLKDQGHDVPHQLREMGYTVEQVM